MNTQVMPNFICIGAQRAGTTWLYQNLREHPDVFVPQKKELRFFNYNYDKGLAHYAEHFSGADQQHARGELTPDYYHQPEAMSRIAADLPHVKLILVLRNPVDRAYSQYELYRGTEYESMSFRDTYLKHPQVIDWGRYGQCLRQILELFPREQIHICDYEVLQQNPRAFLSAIFEFIGVDNTFTPANLEQRFNKVVMPNAQRALQSAGLGRALEFFKQTPLAQQLKRSMKDKPKRISETDHKYIADALSEDVGTLNTLLGRDYSSWLEWRS